MSDNSIFDEIRTKVNIVEVVRDRVPNLVKAGRGYKALCPFHKEKTPSFLVSQEKGLFRCFGCGVGGDVIRFVIMMDKITMPEALEVLAKRANITLPQSTRYTRNPEAEAKREQFLKMNETVADYYHNYLCDSQETRGVRQYLKKRNVDDHVVNKFKIGYSPRDNSVVGLLKSNGYKDEELSRSGLVRFADTRNEWYDTFRSRLMFPIFDQRNRIIAFGGRILDDANNEQAKYINSPETMVFSKSRTLYGLSQCSQGVREAGKIVVVEGYMDTISLHQAGFTYAVAPLGTALTNEHVGILKRYSDEVYLSFDSDNSGVIATLRSIAILLAADVYPKVIVIKGAKDPDELLNKPDGAELYAKLIETAKEGFEFYIDTLVAKYGNGTSAGKRNVVKSTIEFMVKIPNEVVKNEALCYLSNMVNIQPEILSMELRKYEKTGSKDFGSDIQRVEVNNKITVEEELLNLVVNTPGLIKDVREFSVVEMLEDKRVADTIKYLMERDEHGFKVCVNDILSMYLNDENTELHDWLSRVVMLDRGFSDVKKTVQGVMKTIEDKYLKRKCELLKKEVGNICTLKQAEDYSPEDHEVVNEYNRIMRRLKGTRH
ncbi:MAG: DNA primase [Elusimicrobiota bacterium]